MSLVTLPLFPTSLEHPVSLRVMTTEQCLKLHLSFDNCFTSEIYHSSQDAKTPDLCQDRSTPLSSTNQVLMPIKCLSVNANRLNHPAKRSSLWKAASTQKADIVAVQETHFQSHNHPKCIYKDFPHIFLATASEKKKGVMVAIRNTVTFELKDSILDIEGQFIIPTCNINKLLLTIVSLYAPNTHQLCFLRRLFNLVSRVKYGSLLLCEDFKLTVDPRMD